MEGDVNQRNDALRKIIENSTGMFDFGSPDVKLNRVLPALVDMTTSNRAN